ncbi:MAG: nuclease-related domain-containing protein [Bryobacteraceae bacterium]
MKAHRGFSIFDARTIALSISRLQEQKLMDTRAHMAMIPPEEWSILPGYTFCVGEVAEASGMEELTVESVLDAFALPPAEKNGAFRALDDFNIANATPLLRSDSKFVLLQSYSLVEALYESPFYWMVADKAYAPTAMQNRGRFTETFCCDRLELVFGKERVHTNVDIFESKARKVGEIDVLVLFGDRAVIVQAKSMRLTLESRKGNDSRIRDDFEKSVQDSYEQGLTCAKRITDPEVKLVGSDGQKIPVPDRVSEIYILCVVADHYPSLQFQSRQFLKYTQTDVIQSPMVLDVFALDAITEMLPSPLLFLSYINRRVGYTERLMATHETVILSHHLKKNLWIEESVDMLMLDDDISVDLDVAMAVRRDGVNGQGTPDGILTRLNSTTVGRIITALESRPEPGVIDFGFLLLAMSGKATTDASRGIDRAAKLARRDRRTHDISLGFDSPKSGFTVHCSFDGFPVAEAQLRRHCELRKYSESEDLVRCLSSSKRSITQVRVQARP